ncbi:MAG: CocE/NonD family hydrolase, partial [Anaerolineae bacterium]
GPSYLGYMQWAVAAASPPGPGSTRPGASLIMVASAENFSVSHPDGAFGLETRLRWCQGIHIQNRLHRRPLREQLVQRFFGHAEDRLRAAFDHLPLLEADVVAAGERLPFYRDIVTHDRPDDAYWTARDHRAAVGRGDTPVHLVGGWYDYYLRGLLRDYGTLRAAGHRPYLTIGPWHHAHPALVRAGLQEGLAWFDAQLKGDPRGLRAGPVRLYVMGAGEWREMEDFPPPSKPVRYYLHDGARLAPEPPTSGSPPDSYRYDPADPTPALGGALLAFRGAGPQDNRPLEARADVLCYTTPPLDRELEVIGPVQLELYARSSLAHTDFLGRLCDVAPDGTSTNVCDGLFRVAPERGEVQADGCLCLQIDLWATAYRFRRGHRLRLHVSSGAHPRWSRNLGTGEPLATGVRMAVAEQTVYHDRLHPSALVLPVVEASWQPLG